MMKQYVFLGALFAVLLIGVQSASAETEAIRQWTEFAATSGNPDHQKWLEAISHPDAVKLAKEWKAFLGYDAPSLITAANIPAELKPGLRITKQNAASFAWLKDYLPEPRYDRLMAEDWFRWDEIPIVPTSNYYMSPGTLASTKKNVGEGKFSVNEKGELLNSKGEFALVDDETAAAIPFVKPKDGMEVNWDFIMHAVGTDKLFFRPLAIDVCRKDNTFERRYEMDLWWQKFHGRGDIPPMPNISGREGIIEGGSVFFLEPFDVRGLAGVRLRYAASDREDDFTVFIPSLRRTRVLSASDAQDPLASGLDLTWDDWRAYWQKTNIDEFEYKMVGEGFVLAQPEVGHVYPGQTRDPQGCDLKQIELELRPVWIYEILDKSGRYQYSRRVLYIDKEFYYMQYMITYDPRGNIYRIWDEVRDFVPDKGLYQWQSVNLWNLVSRRINFLVMDAVWDTIEEDVNESIMDVDQLRDYK
jgi:hypothetical protein